MRETHNPQLLGSKAAQTYLSRCSELGPLKLNLNKSFLLNILTDVRLCLSEKRAEQKE